MTGQKIFDQCREILGKQLELLTEASQKCKPRDLAKLSEAMVLVAKELRS